MIHPDVMAKGSLIVAGYVAAIYLAFYAVVVAGLRVWGLMRRNRPISDEPERLIPPPHRIFGRP